MKMLRSEILKKRLERVQNICAPHKESKKDSLILTIQAELIFILLQEALQRMYKHYAMPKFKTGGYISGNASEFILNDIGGVNYGKPESESDFIKRKLISEEKNRCLN